MARPNYAYAKRQKELAKKQKKEAKRLRKLEKKGELNPEEPGTAPVDSTAPIQPATEQPSADQPPTA